MQLEHWGKSDVGRRREKNEDSFLMKDDINLFMVADGMGGHVGGEYASKLAVDTVEAILEELTEDPDMTLQNKQAMKPGDYKSWLSYAIKTASKKIYEQAQGNQKLHGMGTTSVICYFKNNKAYFANVGDSRGYRFRSGKLERLTQDHSLLEEQIRAGIVKPSEAKEYRLKNVITRSVGFQDDVEVDTMAKAVKKNDIYLLCSDGLYNMVSDEEMLDIVRSQDLETACKHLIDVANSRGGEDNITVILVKVAALGKEDSEEEEEETLQM